MQKLSDRGDIRPKESKAVKSSTDFGYTRAFTLTNSFTIGALALR
jgi:hypothetical protein